MDLSRFFPPSILDQSFGLCISPEDLIYPSYNFHRTNYYRPWKWYMQRAEKDFGSTIQDEKEKFKIALDVQHFLPEEINVKVADKEIIIEGKHEERQDNHGFISRQFKRRYFLPQDCDADSVVSSLSSDGVLMVTAQKMKEHKNKEIVVPIQMCETCPNKDLKNKIENKEIIENIKKADKCETSIKGMEIMLKEDHCCLLKPELLGAPSGVEKTQTKKGDEMIKTTVCDMKTSEKLDASGQSSASMTETNTICGLTSTGKSEIVSEGKKEIVASGMTSTGKTEQLASGMKCTEATEKNSRESKAAKSETMVCGLTDTGITEKFAGSKIDRKITETTSAMTSAEITETLTSAMASAGMSEKISTMASAGMSDTLTSAMAGAGMSETLTSAMAGAGMSETLTSAMASAGMSEKTSAMTSAGMSETVISGMSSVGKPKNVDALLCGLSSGGKTEKESILSGLSSAAKSQESEAVACGITSEVLTENAESSTSAKSEMCNIKSMLNETIQISESSTSYSSSMASSIKETTEKISEIMNDISAQLKEAAENI